MQMTSSNFRDINREAALQLQHLSSFIYKYLYVSCPSIGSNHISQLPQAIGVFNFNIPVKSAKNPNLSSNAKENYFYLDSMKRLQTQSRNSAATEPPTQFPSVLPSQLRGSNNSIAVQSTTAITIAVLSILGTLLLLVVIGTAYDIFKNRRQSSNTVKLVNIIGSEVPVTDISSQHSCRPPTSPRLFSTNSSFKTAPHSPRLSSVQESSREGSLI